MTSRSTAYPEAKAKKEKQHAVKAGDYPKAFEVVDPQDLHDMAKLMS
jgi:hypothetical protein